jgi:hypothetical protein
MGAGAARHNGGGRLYQATFASNQNPIGLCRLHSDIIASLVTATDWALNSSLCKPSTPSRATAAVDEAITPVSKSEARIAPSETVARTTSSALKSRHFFAVMQIRMVTQIHISGRAAEHWPRLCEAPSGVPGLRRRRRCGSKHRHDAGSLGWRV